MTNTAYLANKINSLPACSMDTMTIDICVLFSVSSRCEVTDKYKQTSIEMPTEIFIIEITDKNFKTFYLYLYKQNI